MIDNFCSICIKYVGERCFFVHCDKCDMCHLNNKNYHCDVCRTCINLTNDLEVIKHRKRHDECIQFRTKKLKFFQDYKIAL
jgi:hypothetical protein